MTIADGDHHYSCNMKFQHRRINIYITSHFNVTKYLKLYCSGSGNNVIK